MGGKSGIKLPKIKVEAPKITVGKDLGAGNIAKAATSVAQTVGKTGGDVVKTLGKGAEGIVANTADIGQSLAKGDFKGIGKEALELVQSGKDIAKGLTSANVGLTSGLVGAAGSSIGDKNIVKASQDINREANKGINTYGDAAIDVGANIATGGTYGLAKTAAQGLSSGGLGGLVSGKGLQEAALGAAGSYAGIDPNMLKMGISAAQGDLKGAALQGLGSFAGLTPEQMKMATTGAAALTGDKKGLVSGLASQFGAGADVASMLGSVAGGNKNDMISALGGQLGLDPKTTSMLGAVASGDIKGEALKQLAGATGLDPKLLDNVSKGKFDPMQLAGAAGFSPSSLLGGAADKLGISALTSSPEAKEMMEMGRSAGRDIASIEKNIQEARSAAESTYKIAAGDTLNTIAKKMGVDPKALAEANNIKDVNKIAAGAVLKIPGVSQAQQAVSGARKSITDKYLKDASGKTIYGPNNAPIPNPDYNQEEADKLAMQQQGGTGQSILMPEEPGFLDKAKDFLGGIGDKVTGAVGAVGDYIKENPNVAATAVQGAAAVGGYMAGEASREEREKLLEKQILETQGVQALKNYQLSKERDKAYGEQQQFLEERIAGGGMTAKEREMQEQGRLRAARMAAAGRLAGVEQQARMGQGVTGAGSALAASLAGAQAQAQAGAESERAAATSAAENVEKAFAARPAALEAKAKAEMDLAQMKDAQELAKLQQIGVSRAGLGAIEAGRGEAQGRLIATGADLATGAIYDRPVLSSTATDKEKEIAAQAEADRQKALQTKAGAAATVSGTAPTQTNAQVVSTSVPQKAAPAPQTQVDQFNAALRKSKAEAPQTTGVYAPTAKPQNPVDNMMKIVQNPSQAVKNPQQTINTVKQVASNPQAAKAEVKKAVGGIVPDSLKNIIKF